MSMLNVRLNDEDDQKLEQILTITKSDKSTLVRKLILDQWVALQAGKTFVERRGGHPKNVAAGPSNLSAREERKSELAKQYKIKSKARAKSK